ncbi:hypothetical protein L7F45_003435 [Salmonella enterica subsp. enterica serovar Mgulani]|nr:hypothetical protein [Salmonella enterica subsp. enterica serovar Mgulani]
MTVKIGRIVAKDCGIGLRISGDNIEIDSFHGEDIKGEAVIIESHADTLIKDLLAIKEAEISLRLAKSELENLQRQEITVSRAHEIFSAAGLSKWLKVGTDLVQLATAIIKMSA